MSKSLSFASSRFCPSRKMTCAYQRCQQDMDGKFACYILSQVLEALENNTKILLLNYLQDLAKPQLIE